MSENEIIKQNINLIKYTIKKYNYTFFDDEEFQNLYDAGIIGLLNGIRTFKESKEYKMSTYLIVCIRNSINRYLEYINRKNRRDTVISLDCENENGTKLIDVIEDGHNLENDIIKKLQIEYIEKKVLKLKPRNQVIMNLRFGLNGFAEHSQVEIANLLGTTHQNVGLIVKSSINQLKKTINEERIKSEKFSKRII